MHRLVGGLTVCVHLAMLTALGISALLLISRSVYLVDYSTPIASNESQWRTEGTGQLQHMMRHQQHYQLQQRRLHHHLHQQQRQQQQQGAQQSVLIGSERDRFDERNLTYLHHSIEMTSEAEFERRRLRVRDVCRGEYVPGGVLGVFTHERTGVLYCFVPKTGCTFWKRLFNAVNTDNNPTLNSVFSQSRLGVHSGTHAFGRPLSGRDTSRRYPTRFMVTRDPFSRLLSAYLDKAYLPDFWETPMKDFAEKIISPINDRDFLRQHFNQLAREFDPTFLLNASSTFGETRCGKYLTFAEFATASLGYMEPHWSPIHRLCNPCTLNITHVSQMRSFTQDAKAILSKMELDDLLDGFDQVKQVNEELETIVIYNFERVSQPDMSAFYETCISTHELAQRLWNNFRWRGYIHPEVDYVRPESTKHEEVKDDLMAQIWRARDKGLRSVSLMKKYKQDFLHRAFSSLTKGTFNKIVKLYNIDFKLFGYEEDRDRMSTLYE